MWSYGEDIDGRRLVPTEEDLQHNTGVDLLQVLRKLRSHWDSWLSQEQTIAVAAIVEARTDVIVAIRPGGGKTAVVAAAAKLTPGLTVVIVPLIVLKPQWVINLRSFHVRVCEFYSAREQQEYKLGPSSRDISDEAEVVVVSADVAAFSKFQHAMGMRKPRGSFVARIVIDEAQTYVLSGTFRPNLLNPFTLRRQAVQLVLLSGTVPPAMVGVLSKTFMLQDPYVVRSGVTRRNVRYVIDRTTHDGSERELKNWLARIIETSIFKQFMDPNPHDKVLIFVPYINLGDALAAFLDCDFHRSLASTRDTNGPSNGHTENARILTKWDNNGGYLVATPGSFGAGVDYCDVRVVLFVLTPVTLIEGDQALNRVGRDGLPALAIILPSTTTHRPAREKMRKEAIAHGLPDVGGFDAIETLTSHPLTKECVRGHFTFFLDGVVGQLFNRRAQH